MFPGLAVISKDHLKKSEVSVSVWPPAQARPADALRVNDGK